MSTAASNRSKSLAFLSCPRDSVWFLRHNGKGFVTAELLQFCFFGQVRGCYLGSDGVGFVFCREGCKRRISVGMNIM
jgi:hypothetical protein